MAIHSSRLKELNFNKLELDCKEEQYMTLNTIAFRLLKQYVSSLKNIFIAFVDYFKKARLLIICRHHSVSELLFR